MKLSKKNAAQQRVIQKAIASGKALGGLLVGLTAATVVGGCKETSPASTMGSYPRPQQQANAKGENIGEFVTGGAIAVPEPEPAKVKPNAVQEQRGKPITMGKMPARSTVPPKPPLPAVLYRVKDGDSLTKIARTYGTTVAELKRLNGFDDVRADKLVIGEVIKVPQPKPNVVNEVKKGSRPRLPGVPLPSKPRETPQK